MPKRPIQLGLCNFIHVMWCRHDGIKESKYHMLHLKWSRLNKVKINFVLSLSLSLYVYICVCVCACACAHADLVVYFILVLIVIFLYFLLLLYLFSFYIFFHNFHMFSPRSCVGQPLRRLTKYIFLTAHQQAQYSKCASSSHNIKKEDESQERTLQKLPTWQVLTVSLFS